ncbi:MAG: hypothetical protein NTZ59_12985 [Bacteroidetes bacterium]|nr:hypothetical protein [Bacteroidota bacterium]
MSLELDSIENNLSNYQSSHGFVSENSNGQLYLNKVQEIDKKLVDIDIQKANIESIEKFVDNNTDKEFNYNVVGVNDAGIQKNIETLQQLRIEKDKLLNTLTTTHPSIKIIETYIAQTKQNIKVQLSLYKKNINTSREFCLGKINETKSLIKSTPSEEKGLIDIKRMRNIKEALFLALLQKREEAAIAKASTTTDTKILTPAIILPAQQKPSKNIIILFAGLLGFFIPIIFFIVKELVNNKIVSTKQLESYLSIPVLAELEFVENSKNNNNLILKGSDRTLFGEQLRSLRTQLDFYKKENKNLSILITSNISGEGKSFLSFNLT